MRASRPDAAAAGFTLIEVLVALALVGLMLGAAAAVFGNGLIGHRAATDLDAALALADNQLDAAGVMQPLRPSRSSGVEGRFAWALAVTPYDDRGAGADVPRPAAERLYRVAVTVAWRDGARARQVALDTLRLAPAAP